MIFEDLNTDSTIFNVQLAKEQKNRGRKINVKPNTIVKKNMADVSPLSFGIACGGTGGHVYPGMAVAEILQARGHEVTLWLSGRKEEQAATGNWTGPMMTAQSRGLPVLFSPRSLTVVPMMLSAILRCVKQMRKKPPDALLAMGSHASFAPALAAALLGVPLILHEANVVPGLTIRLLSRLATTIAIGFEETRESLKNKRTTITGMPLRSAAISAGCSNLFSDLKADIFTLLIMGGSLGAHALNDIASAAVIKLRKAGHEIQVIHLAGSSDENFIRDKYTKAAVPSVVFGFLNDIGKAYELASFALCRAGASTCAELSHHAMPALLVPYPKATHQHQLANARALQKHEAVDVIEEKDIDENRLADYLLEMMNDKSRMQKMKKASHERLSGNAAINLADLVETIAKQKRMRNER